MGISVVCIAVIIGIIIVCSNTQISSNEDGEINTVDIDNNIEISDELPEIPADSDSKESESVSKKETLDSTDELPEVLNSPQPSNEEIDSSDNNKTDNSENKGNEKLDNGSTENSSDTNIGSLEENKKGNKDSVELPFVPFD